MPPSFDASQGRSALDRHDVSDDVSASARSGAGWEGSPVSAAEAVDRAEGEVEAGLTAELDPELASELAMALAESDRGEDEDEGKALSADSPMRFFNHFEDYMEVNADPATYARYLDVHEEWFRRCARPMQVEPLGHNGYALTIGRFGAFDYYVEPKIGLELLPQDLGVYRIRTIPVPDYVPPGYEVDFQASMNLVERDPLPDSGATATTHVTWVLDLTVDLWFPKFIRVLPKKLLQRTGDRLLAQIVRQVSRRLTRKVQADFHETFNLPLPAQFRRR